MKLVDIAQGKTGSVTTTNRVAQERDLGSYGSRAKLSRHGSALRLKQTLSRGESQGSRGSVDDARDKRYRLRPGRYVETMSSID